MQLQKKNGIIEAKCLKQCCSETEQDLSLFEEKGLTRMGKEPNHSDNSLELELNELLEKDYDFDSSLTDGPAEETFDEEEERRKYLLRVRLMIAAVVLVLLASVGVYLMWYAHNHVYVAGKFYDIQSTSLDVRGKHISLGEYLELSEKYPQFKILWDVPVQGKSYPTTTSKLTVTALTQDDVDAMSYLPKLRQVEADNCKDYALLMQIADRYPRVRVTYRVRVGSKDWPSTVTEMDVSRKTAEELLRNLAYLPEVVRVNFTDTMPAEDDMQALEQKYPRVVFYGTNADGVLVQRSGNPETVVLDNKVYPLSSTVLDLTDAALADDEDLVEKIGRFPNLEVVCLENTDLNENRVQSLKNAYPEIRFLSKLGYGTVELSASAKTVDISGQTVTNVADVEELLPFFPELTKVVMSDCGISNEEMAELNARYEDIEFVWSVKLGQASVRTDERVFSIGTNTGVWNDDLDALKYCTSMMCVDIYRARNITSIEWAASMPDLTFLVISETKVSDLTPLTGLKKLSYLEMFSTQVRDYSPLVTCTALHDLNLGWTYGEPEPIAEMKWLKNVYWGDCTNRNRGSGRAPAVLALALPEANLVFTMNSAVAEGWRRLNNYYVMRDLMGLPYQDQHLKVSADMLARIAMVDGSASSASTKK